MEKISVAGTAKATGKKSDQKEIKAYQPWLSSKYCNMYGNFH